ncbi:enoyl-CoA hydratase/isomerase family protein [Kutzneria albida]|uniref:Enoyl-CoA hydratase n=1 Tax=Kutzneria albida DSM 43870 TaxID=1449976 RepID=W5WQN6_9PSEU|nr:enoyl-CoA hydratase/isomerase family protein [Kutzneria albida]AHI00495.1 hypothetical protein KALB_7137 [Kutzneria albida DSM 43870]
MISVERDERVAVLRLAHGKVNALDLELLRAITSAMAELRAEDGVDAVVLTGSGRAFSAGVDLRRVLDGGPAYVRQYLPALTEAILAVFDWPRPVVAAINGHAIAGGCVFAAACDLRLMSQGTIGVTELLVGVPFPAAALEVFRHAAGIAGSELVLSGRTVDPATARAAGLLHAVVEPERLLPEAVSRARQLAAIPRAAYEITKRQLHRPAAELIATGRRLDDPAVEDHWCRPEIIAGIGAYLDRITARRPS